MNNNESEEMRAFKGRLKEYKERRDNEWQKEVEIKGTDRKSQDRISKQAWGGWKTLIITGFAFFGVLIVSLVGNWVSPSYDIIWAVIGGLGIPFILAVSIWLAIVFYRQGESEKAAGVWLGIGIGIITPVLLTSIIQAFQCC
ncbi:MAG: hypothetical protein JSW16_02450 [Dehalococcoidales bacterium]|nr:MAG: hypothetical protein JSW16_02450 [Dehalococcoidales bacterium]